MANPTDVNNRRTSVIVINSKSVLCAVLLIVVVLVVTSNRFWRFMYPIEYQPVIQKAASHAKVDPLLVASIIRVESKFHSSDVSHAGAVGLMQLMPSTAQWISGKMTAAGLQSAASKGPLDVSNPTVNITLGSWYVRYLINRFASNEVAAVAAYNAGPQRVSEWLAEGTWNGRLNSIPTIPVGETRHFVDRVFYNYTLYKRIYGREPAWAASSP